MSKINDALIQLIRERCEKGYLTKEDWDVLNPVAKGFEVKQSDLLKAAEDELKPIRKRKMDEMFASLKQPEAAIAERVAFSAQSKRAFPDILYIGKTKLELNRKLEAPAFVPVKGSCGFCIVHNGKTDAANNLLQNVLVRLMLSLPKKWAKMTLVDPVNYGSDFMALSGIDSQLCAYIIDDKAMSPYFQQCFRDISIFEFNDLSNRYTDLEEYNRSSGSPRPYQMVVIPNISQVLDDALSKVLAKIAQKAGRTGVFFLLTIDADSYEEAKPWLDMFHSDKSDLCILDITGSKAKVISREPVDFLNNAFEISIQTELAFDSRAISEYNHEFAPDQHEIVADVQPSIINKGENTREALMVELGVSEPKGKPYQVAMKQECGNMIALVNDKKTREGMAASILGCLGGKYTDPDELQFAAFNVPLSPKLVSQSQVMDYAKTSDISELKRLLGLLEQTLEERKATIASENATDYHAYRNRFKGSMPRIAFLIDLSGLENQFTMDVDAMEVMRLLQSMMQEMGKYGIHVILLWKPGEHLFSFDWEALFDVKVFSSLTEKDFYACGLLSLPPDEKEYQEQTKHALVVTRNGNVKLQLGNNAKN